MIGLDTNVVVRYLVEDDPVQSPLASKVIDSLSEASRGFISIVTLVEISWVLTRAYGASRKTLVGTIQGLLESAELTIEQSEAVRATLPLVAEGADFSDAVIARLGEQAGCEATVTFDRRAGEGAGMQLIRPNRRSL
jgi:predicted nucleic-acid-binding protein